MTTTQDLEQRALALPEQANVLLITSVDTYTAATDLLLTVKALLKEVDETFSPIINKAYQTHREALAQKKRHEDPLLRAEAILKPRIAAYLEAEEQKRLTLERKAQEAAQMQEALDADARGDQAATTAALDGQGIVSVHVPSDVPKVAGIASRELWSAEVVDFRALIKAVAGGLVPLACLLPNQAALNQQARALKQSMDYPGVKPICVKTVAAGARL